MYMPNSWGVPCPLAEGGGGPPLLGGAIPPGGGGISRSRLIAQWGVVSHPLVV